MQDLFDVQMDPIIVLVVPNGAFLDVALIGVVVNQLPALNCALLPIQNQSSPVSTKEKVINFLSNNINNKFYARVFNPYHIMKQSGFRGRRVTCEFNLSKAMLSK